MKTLRTFWDLIRNTYTEWQEDDAPMFGAAIAYYAIFSIAPLLIIAIAVAGFVFGGQAATGEIFDRTKEFVGEGGANMLQSMVQNANRAGAGGISAAIGVVAVLLGASNLFAQLRKALNRMWEAEPEGGGGLRELVKEQLAAFLMVLAVGLLLLLSLFASAGVSFVSRNLPSWASVPPSALYWADFLISLLLVTILFAAIYKFLPEREVRWNQVWVGAIVASVLFGIGKFALGFYLGHSGVASVYGAAGSLVVLLLWVFVSAQVLFFGAEFTQVYSKTFGMWGPIKHSA